MRIQRFCFGLLFVSTLGFGQDAPAAPATPPAATEAAPRPDGYYATIHTSMGPITVQLFEKESPVTVKNFVDLALGRKTWTHPKTGVRSSRPLYPGTTFHRVIPGFMIQGGDPLGNGTGGTDTIKDEFPPGLTFDQPGRLAMANAGPNTGSCQFFLTEVPTPHLNGRHTIFGQVVENQELISKIARVPRGANDRPLTPVTIQRITFERWADGKLVRPAPATKAAPKAPAKAATPAAKPAAPAAKPAAPAAKPAAPKPAKQQ